MIDYKNYYTELAQRGQHGGNIAGYAGFSKFQRGHGFFGNLFSKAILPGLKYLGKQALKTGVNVASDVISNKRDFVDSLKDNLEESGRTIANDGLERAKKFIIEGKGSKRKKRSKSIKKKVARKDILQMLKYV